MNQKQKNRPLPWIVSFFLALICAVEVIPLSANAIEFPTSPKRNSPRSTAAGGRRGGCVVGQYPIQAFTPNNKNYIKTVSSQPEWFVYH